MRNKLRILMTGNILFLAGILVGASTVVLATHDPNVIHACVAQGGSENAAQNMQGQANSGSARIVSSEADCRSGETHITWSIQGPPGPPGPQGPQGPQGLQGPPGANGLACWDLNGNGVFDAAEDINADGVANTLDCQPLNADKVDGFDAYANPVPNALLALDGAGRFPISVIPQGPGSGLDADTVDGLHASDFTPFNHHHDGVYVNEGQVNSITTGMIVDDSVSAAKVQDITRIITANLMGLNSESIPNTNGFGVRLMSTGGSVVLYTFAVPYDYAGGDLLIREWWREHDAAGTAKVFRWVSKLTPSGQDIGLESAASFDVTSSCCIPSRTWQLPAAWITSGDIFWVEMERRGDLPDDTMGRLDLRAVGVEYQAVQ